MIYAAVKNGSAIFGKDLNKLLEQADPNSNYREFNDNELLPSVYVIHNKILNSQDKNDSKVIKANEIVNYLYEELRNIDQKYGSRPFRDYILEKEPVDKVWYKKVVEGENLAVEKRKEIRKQFDIINGIM